MSESRATANWMPRPGLLSGTLGRTPVRLSMALAIAVFLFCGYLRFLNLDWGLEAKSRAGWHPDEQIVVGVSSSLEANHFDTDMKLAPIPEGLQWARYNFSSYVYAAYLWNKIAAPIDHLLFSRHGTHAVPDTVAYRQLSAWLGLLACVLTYACARKLLDPALALLAVGLVGVFPLLVQDSHYARAEAFVTAGSAALLLLTLTIRRNQTRALCFWTGVLCGILAACKISLTPLVFLPLLAVLVPLGRDSSVDAKRVLTLCGLVATGFAAGLLLGVPYGAIHWREYWRGWRHLKDQYSHPFYPFGPDPAGYCFGYMGRYFAATLGIPLWLAFAAGVFHLVRKRLFVLCAILVGPVFFYALMFGAQFAFFERNVSHIMPWIALIAALGCAELWEWLHLLHISRESRSMILALAIGVILWVPFTLSWRLAAFVLSGQTYDAMAEYESALSKNYQGLPFVQYDGWTSKFLEQVGDYLKTHPSGFVLKVGDANDDISHHRLRAAQQIFNMKPLATVPGHFPDLPTSTLQMYHGRNYSWYLVRPNID
jgi:hypothetical protein